MLDEKVRRLRTHGITKDNSKFSIQHSTLNEPWYYEMHEVGFNYRITDFQCALGSSQVKKLDYFVEKRREIAKKYDEVFSCINNFTIPETNSSIDHAYHIYSLQIDFNELDLIKVKLFEKMKQSGIKLQVHYIPVHLHPFYQKKFGFKLGDFPMSEDFYRREVSMPLYPELSNYERVRVIDNVIHNLND